ncbi:MAG: lysine exporter LysO family protein [Candidatus Edwardsbacteria bacterium]|nr:lysine exporter LysO family protein [Candidatus Edwardsbacteria bacterium]MBU1576358.1 lysine exporter LysO family protein [Candidatus Edwardsbacteria bacterium]MBU2462770.1 lysine exporter LysO family protein [Candidatus Edwardsbacteria bacterium]MBU2593535.1 lysine exporter LysO family protein [Candidatus Edwardsbacteria bacterium]
MKNSLIIVGFFALGVILAVTSLVPEAIIRIDLSAYALYILMFLVGIGIGADRKAWEILKNARLKIVLVPLTVIIGTLMGVSFISVFLKDINLRESLAVGAGFGYYSLSSIFIGQISGQALGVVALISNISREIITLLGTPLLVRYFGKLAPIASGGATSMDTTLPIITKFTGKEYAIISVFSGVVLTILVPFLVTFILKF